MQLSESQHRGVVPENLTVRQFGELYGPKATKTYALLKSGELRGVKIGRNTYISRAEAERWAKSLPAFKSDTLDGAQKDGVTEE